MTAFEKHQKFLKDFVFFYGDEEKYYRDQQPHRRNDFDVIREETRFVWQGGGWHPDDSWVFKHCLILALL